MKLSNKVCAFFLCAALCLSSIPLTARAAELEDASKGLDFSQGFPQEKTVYTAGGGTITYTPPSSVGQPHKLILNNATISTEESSKAPAICFSAEQVYMDISVEIEVKGENTITVNNPDSDKNYGRNHAIFLSASDKECLLKISGGGTLNLNAVAGIGAQWCNVEISGVTVNTFSPNRFSYGIYTVFTESVEIKEASLNLNSSQGVSVNKGKLSIQNSSLIINSNAEALSGAPVHIESSTIDAYVRGNDVMGGITSRNKSLEIINSKVSLNGPQCRYGVFTHAGVHVDNSELYLNCPYTSTDKTPYVIFNEEPLVIENQSIVTLIYYPGKNALKNVNTQADEGCQLKIEVVKADYSELDKIVKSIPEDLSIYTAVSVEALNNVLGSLDYEKDITKQNEVDEMAKAIEEAVAALEYKGADYGKVDEAIEKAAALNKDEYKDFSKVEEAIGGVVRDKNITEQWEVDEMAKAIEDAIKGLEKKESEKPTAPVKLIAPVKNSPNTVSSPQTGDDTDLGIWMALIALSALVMASAIIENQKQRTYSAKRKRG